MLLQLDLSGSSAKEMGSIYNGLEIELNNDAKLNVDRFESLTEVMAENGCRRFSKPDGAAYYLRVFSLSPILY